MADIFLFRRIFLRYGGYFLFLADIPALRRIFSFFG
jgi:hypothetical protein